MPRLAALLTLAVAVAGCIPNGPPTGSSERAPSASSQPKAKVAPPKPAGSVAADPVLATVFVDDFDRGLIGPEWRSLGGAWRVQDGKLCGKSARNRGIWLTKRLPVNARIEFDAQSASADGDIKVELWGDGLTGATAASYNNATSYIAIFGGWKNTLHVLARLDEHADSRLELKLVDNPDDPRARPVTPNQIYRFRIERADRRTVHWFVDDAPVFKLEDADPLSGDGHDHFGFNDWEAPVCFDNLKITPLE